MPMTERTRELIKELDDKALEYLHNQKWNPLGVRMSELMHEAARQIKKYEQLLTNMRKAGKQVDLFLDGVEL